MKELKCKNITLNNKDTKICVPITGKNTKEISTQAKIIKKSNPDIVEWRCDFCHTNEENIMEDISKALDIIHKEIVDIPIIFTFRTANEGGERQIDFDTYRKYCETAAQVAEKYNVAFVDVEAYENNNESGIHELIEYIQKKNVKVIGSNHHFDKTPEEKDIIEILTEMSKMNVDVCKVAVMPKQNADVETLINASMKADKILEKPIITMSMSELGAVTRVCTRITGSVLTFATGTQASAPGQMSVDVVRYLLDVGKNCRITKNIALIGFMGTGKTTISRTLSRITGLPEVDVDKCIVEKSGMEINTIFEKYGEEHFRMLETQELKELMSENGSIISCGGGAVLKDENVEILKSGGEIVLLTATPETIFDRVKHDTHRPLLNSDMSLKHVRELMDQREPRYQSVADIKVNVNSNDRVLSCYDMLKQLEQKGLK